MVTLVVLKPMAKSTNTVSSTVFVVSSEKKWFEEPCSVTSTLGAGVSA